MHILRILSLLIFAVSIAAAQAQDTWQARQIVSSNLPTTIVAETRQPAPNGLPDGLIATRAGGDIISAWYEGPTTRYDHGILGDAIEAGEIRVSTANGNILSIVLTDNEVFEDRTPRLADLDGDGTVEVIAIRSSIIKGASVTIYGLDENRLVQLAATGFIGRSHRWLNIAAIARLRGRRGQEIAFVQTPHIGGTLFIYEYDHGALKQVARMHGFSNHAIGSREMRLSAIADVNSDGHNDLAVPSSDRRTLRIVGFDDNDMMEFAAVTLPARIDKAILATGSGRSLRFIVGIETGAVFEIAR